MGKAPAFQFYPGDWIQDTRILTPLTRGIWIDMLCFMWRSDDRGKLIGTECQLSRILSCEKEELRSAVTELSVTKIADVTERNGEITVVNRRMFREQKERENGRIRAQRYRDNKPNNADSNAKVTAPSSSSSSSSCTKVHSIVFDAGKFTGISQEQIERWQSAFPATNIKAEILKAATWIDANPKNKKSNWKRFLANWFSRAQDRAPAQGGTSGTYQRLNQFGKPVPRQKWEDEAERLAREYEQRKAAKNATDGQAGKETG